MIIAVTATLLVPGLRISPLLVIGLGVGVLAGVLGARTVPMTDMPQMVALLNGLGGGAAALVSCAEILRAQWAPPTLAQSLRALGGEPVHHGASLVELLGVLIGSVSFSGSAIAFGKLQGIVSEKAISAWWTKLVNGGLLLTIIGMGWLAMAHGGTFTLIVFLMAALGFGVLMVMPIGGADMPVVISLLNSFTGLAAAATGFVLDNR